MSDQRIRDLERQALTGDREASVRLLTERLRAGDLARERLELAAYCGDEMARTLAWCACGHPWDSHDDGARPSFTSRLGCLHGWAGPGGGCECKAHAPPGVTFRGDPRPDAEFREWLSGLSRWADIGPVPGWVLVKAAVAAARVALPKWRDSHSHQMTAWDGIRPCCYAPVKVIEAAETWLECPCEEHRLGGVRALSDHYRRSPDDDWWASPAVLVMEHNRSGYFLRCVHDCARLAGEQSVRSAISRSLSTWALS